MRRVLEYWERRQQLADRCARGGALCTARSSPAIPYRSMAFFGQELPTPPFKLYPRLLPAPQGDGYSVRYGQVKNLNERRLTGGDVTARAAMSKTQPPAASTLGRIIRLRRPDADALSALMYVPPFLQPAEVVYIQHRLCTFS